MMMMMMVVVVVVEEIVRDWKCVWDICSRGGIVVRGGSDAGVVDWMRLDEI